MLEEFRKWQRKKRVAIGDRWVECDRLFTQDDSSPIHPDSITSWFHDFILRTNLPHILIHSLRHTSIKLLLAAGVPLRTVSWRAEHARISTTANIYSHAICSAAVRCRLDFLYAAIYNSFVGLLLRISQKPC